MNQIAIHGDCLAYMRTLPDLAYDWLFADPPRGDGTATKMAKKSGEIVNHLGIPKGNYPSSEWDLISLSDQYFEEMFRVSRNQIIWCAPFYTHFLPPRKKWIIWDKLTTGNFGDIELAWSSLEGAHRKITFKWNGFQQGRSIKRGHVQHGDKRKNEKRIHPTQKPTKLYEWMIREFVGEKESIYDPSLGSGSSRIAAARMNREFVGTELDEQHFKDSEAWFYDEIIAKPTIFT